MSGDVSSKKEAMVGIEAAGCSGGEGEAREEYESCEEVDWVFFLGDCVQEAGNGERL